MKYLPKFVNSVKEEDSSLFIDDEALRLNNIKTENLTNEKSNYFPEDWQDDYDLVDELDFYEQEDDNDEETEENQNENIKKLLKKQQVKKSKVIKKEKKEVIEDEDDDKEHQCYR